MCNKVIYIHRKPCGQVFYVGIGKPSRAYDKNGRSLFWRKTINKYPNYEVIVLKRNLTIEDACELEILLIDYYGRKDLGLGSLVNLTNGGEGVIGISEDRKLYGDKNPMFGKRWSDTEKENFRKKSLGENNAMFGKDWRDNATEEQVINWKNKIGESSKGSIRTDTSRKILSKEVYQYSKEGEYIDSYFGTREAERQTNINAQSISSNCLGKRKSAGGFIWTYIKK